MRFSDIPTDPRLLVQWAEDFRAEFGCYPFAGAETEGGEGGAATATAEPPEGAGEGEAGGEGAPSAPDLTALESRMDDVLGRLTEFDQRLPAAAKPPDPAEEAARSTLEELFGPAPQQPEAGGQPEEGDADGENFLRSVIDQGVDQRVRAALEPVLTQFNQERQTREEDRRARETDELISDYPELKEEKQRTEIIGEAQAWARDLGNPALAGEPGFIELVLLAGKTAERASGETRPGGEGQQVTLEPGGGGNPGGAPEPDRAQQIADAGTKPGFW